ncbi:10337_t:CDS:2 [Ambispora leptoticha]|uniref:10337_t:CDS:1 n=1 Tax=Ambispora leptoticha TaxID=144679 RepID=A0A9N9BVS9_9GLOM|nr:10337_t:CDS:2 [Ambispora leptoticha]
MVQNSFQTLTQLLQKDQRLVVNGNLAKNKIIELALQLDTGILKLLKSSPELRKIFFVEVDDILVFDKIKFQNFISNKQFLPDSFTQYKNKIGLVADRQYLANSAPDEIDRLLTPKVLTNFQKYNCGKEVEMTDISLNDNLIIKGNNLLSLYSLKEKYQGKIKLIYIDPPYNPDIAKKLLSPGGCLIVAIDKNEQAELTVLLKELFRGYEIHVITIVHNPRGVQGTNFSYTHEYAIFNKKIIGFGDVSDEDYHPEILVKTGIIPDNTIKRKLIVKNEFKNTEFFNSGLLFLNRQEKYPRDDVFELPSSIRDFPYKVSLRTNINLSRGLFESQFKESIEIQEKDFWIKNLKSQILDEFIVKDEYLGGIKITVSGLASQLEELSPDNEFDILVKVIGQIASSLTSGNPDFRGSKEFKYILLKEKIGDKELNFAPSES